LIEPAVDSVGRTYVSRSQRALQRVQELVDGLLAFARSGAQPGADARSAIDEVLANVVADASEAARAAGIDLVLEPSDHVEVACRVGVMTSIAQNLVRNAIKYMRDAPVKRVSVRARAAGETVRLEVEDTGPGISADLQKHLFEPFVRGDHEHIEGIGLGLATVKRLVEGHGGRLGVKSEAGSGALFWVELPRAFRESGGRVGV
jgi:signal transduction histidine kinase